jgi:hypothetical protein
MTSKSTYCSNLIYRFREKSFSIHKSLKRKEAASNAFLIRFFKFLTLITSIFLTTQLVDAINIPGYGFDLTDQSLYILEASRSSDYLGWGFGYGWFTSMVYYVSNSDIEQFRANFSYILFLLNFWLSFRIIKILDSFQPTSGTFVRISIVFIGSVSFNLILLPINRTPGYNLINYISIIIAIIGFTYLLPLNNSKFSIVTSNILISASYLFGITSKPSTPLFLILSINIACLLFYNWRRVLMNIAAQTFGFIILIYLLMLIKKLPLNFFEQLYSKLSMTPITDESGVNYALKGLIIWPYRLLSDLLFINKLALFFLLISFFLIIRYKSHKRFLLFSLLSFFLYFTLAITFKPDLKISFVIQYDRFQHTITLFSWLMFFIYLVIISKTVFDKQIVVLPQTIKANFMFSILTILFGISILVFGFGSGNGLVIMGVMCISFVVFMCQLTILKISDVKIKKILLGMTLLMTIYGSFIDYLGRKNFDYRGEYFSSVKVANYQEVFVSPGQKNLLKVSPILGYQIKNINRKILSTNIINPKSDLLNIVYPWAPGYSIILGSNNPPSTLLTIFGYENSLVVMKELQDSVNKDYNYKNALLLKSNYDSLDSNGIEQSNQALSLIEAKSGLTFPKDYEIIYIDSLVELYKPKNFLK